MLLNAGERFSTVDSALTKRFGFVLTEQDLTLFEQARDCLLGQCDDHDEPLSNHSERLVEQLRRLHVDDSCLLAAAFGSSQSYAPAIALAKKGISVEANQLLEHLVRVRQLGSLHLSVGLANPLKSQETLRKLFLALASDLRVVLIVLASRLQTLRWYASQGRQPATEFAQETLDVLAPLANRLGVWQIKWELEDLGLRFANPQRYQWIAGQLEQRRPEREAAIEAVKVRLDNALTAANVAAQVSGRPKHIFSIHQKMIAKGLSFSEVHDLRALRVVVNSVEDCYTALALVQGIWLQESASGEAQGDPQGAALIARAVEFDDYIAKPKANGYKSIHIVVWDRQGRAFEIQIRTQAMHEHAEYGVAAHWIYKEQGKSRNKLQNQSQADDAAARQMAWMRQLLSWQVELGLTLSADTAQSLQDEHIYVLTPQARVIELPVGSTPIDFAYHVHSSLGHKCRGARVDGQMVPLHTPLRSGQTVDIVVVKAGAAKLGPSRDWLNPDLGFVKSTRARNKVRQWFHAQELTNQIASGRSTVEKQLQREGKTALQFDALAQRLGFDQAADLFVAIARDEIGPRAVEEAIRFDPAQLLSKANELQAPTEPAALIGKEHAVLTPRTRSDVLVVGVDLLLTQLARCCRPVPPDPIRGYITRGKGVSIHRVNCASFLALQNRSPERCLDTGWSAGSLKPTQPIYPVDCVIEAIDRQGLLRDITDLLAKNRINVTAMQSVSKAGQATVRLTMEVQQRSLFEQALASLQSVSGIVSARRR